MNRARSRVRTDHYLASLPVGVEHHTTSLITFFCTVADQRSIAYETVIDVGLFELLVWLFHSPNFPWNESSADTNRILTSACESAFSQLLSVPDSTLRLLLDKHIKRIWVPNKQPCLSDIVQSIDTRSEYLWLEIEARFWEREALAWHNFVDRSNRIFESEGSRLFSTFPQLLDTQEIENRCVITSESRL